MQHDPETIHDWIDERFQHRKQRAVDVERRAEQRRNVKLYEAQQLIDGIEAANAAERDAILLHRVQTEQGSVIRELEQLDTSIAIHDAAISRLGAEIQLGLALLRHSDDDGLTG